MMSVWLGLVSKEQVGERLEPIVQVLTGQEIYTREHREGDGDFTLYMKRDRLTLRFFETIPWLTDREQKAS